MQILKLIVHEHVHRLRNE